MILLIAKYTCVLLVVLGFAELRSVSAAVKHLVLALGLFSLPLLYLSGELIPAPDYLTLPEPIVEWAHSTSRGGEMIVMREMATRPAGSPTSPIVFYLMVTGLFVARWLWLVVCTAIRIRRGKRLDLNVEGIRGVCLPGIKSPFAWGILRGIIAVPESFMDWPHYRRSIVLSHESAHLRRRDALLSIVSAFYACLLWWHPLVWIVRRRMTAEAEKACDDLVLADGFNAVEYAEVLLSIKRGHQPGLVVSMAGHSNLTRRIHALLDKHLRRRPMSFRRFSTTAVLFLTMIAPLAGIGQGGSVQPVSAEILPVLESVQALIKETRYEEAKADLYELMNTAELSGNETGQVYNLIGYIHFLEDNYPEAIEAYENALRSYGIPEGLRHMTLYTLAQLNFVEGHYEAALSWVEQWHERAATPGPVPFVFMAQTLYQLKRYPESLEKLNQGLAEAELRGSEVSPRWLELRAYLKHVIETGEAGRIPENGDSDVMLVVRVRPVYPEEAKRRGTEGYVDVQFTVSPDGLVLDPSVVAAQPENVFDEAALESIVRYRFKPRVLDGSPVAAAGVRHRVEFTLD